MTAIPLTTGSDAWTAAGSGYLPSEDASTPSVQTRSGPAAQSPAGTPCLGDVLSPRVEPSGGVAANRRGKVAEAVHKRRSGLVEHGRGFGAHDHVCWRYGDARDFHDRVREFLSEGLSLGYRVCYIGTGDADGLVEDLDGIDGIGEALRTGAAQVASLDATYPVGAVIEPAAQVRTYAKATDAALAAGFAGLRVAADCTSLVRTPEQLDAFSRYEHRIDRYMVDRPFSAMCAYAADEVDDQAFAQVACMHPNTNTSFPGFRLHGAGDRVAALAGEVDQFDDDLFTLALQRADLRPHGGRLVFDAAGLTFLDHGNLLRLSRHAAALGASLVLRTSWSGVSTLVDLLDLTNVRVERAA
ncbi:MEDS domain-containing protein [Saccharothrix sp. Mg75]|uniref:MEDS domain-containing protein n=1 Tax=Saccharothrix sp. Mg75 TaxID=3445357 RepID=UPI003EEE3435